MLLLAVTAVMWGHLGKVAAAAKVRLPEVFTTGGLAVDNTLPARPRVCHHSRPPH